MKRLFVGAVALAACHSDPPRVTAVTAPAVSATPTPPPPPAPKPHTTAVGIVFEWTPDGWKGPDNVVWGKDLGRVDHATAEATCAQMNAVIAGYMDYERADKWGIYEIYPGWPKQANASANSPDIRFWIKGGTVGVWPITAKHDAPDATLQCVHYLDLDAPACSNEKQHERGSRCKTTLRTPFERVDHDRFGDAVRAPNGLIWSQVLAEDLNASEAAAFCKNIGARLPTGKELELGESESFREALYWPKRAYPWVPALTSSTKIRDDVEYLMNTQGVGGGNNVTADRPDYARSVVCVADAK